jgi:hypothetical protein
VAVELPPLSVAPSEVAVPGRHRCRATVEGEGEPAVDPLRELARLDRERNAVTDERLARE